MPEDELKQLLAPCFGAVDREFGGHPIERASARELMAAVCRHNISIGQLEKAARAYLTAKGCPSTHIDKQLARMKELSSWLED